LCPLVPNVNAFIKINVVLTRQNNAITPYIRHCMKLEIKSRNMEKERYSVDHTFVFLKTQRPSRAMNWAITLQLAAFH